MFGLKLKILGVEALQKKLSAETIKTPLGQAIKKITLFTEREAKKAAPWQTGRLRSSITSRIESTPIAPFGVIGTNVKYAEFVEYGTKKMEPRHMVGSRKVFGLGMFGYALSLLKEKMPEFVKDLGKEIQARFDK